MRDWLSSLSSERVPEIALALALGYVLSNLADAAARIPVSVLTQHWGRIPSDEELSFEELLGAFPSPYYLNVSIGDTVIVYGDLLATLVALGLVALLAWLVVRRRDRILGECPFCASRIPFESVHCAYCGSGVEPGTP